ncbi:MAG: hypothetical protein COU65_00535 [Candidatus Pacebacteria bacterium CG10_big_fil_rev_8_21_14_0_10_42_12]|nr:MAG: hypothetical protein COU65_00535 [Candidatus Pacebacteria bacterium CG10_big_fil_rev_8_21_14_0_10_42_12]
MLEKILRSLFFGCLFLILAVKTVGAVEAPTIKFFWADGCPHCAKEGVFLKKLQNKYPELIIEDYEITHDAENSALLEKIGSDLKADVSGVPFTVVGDSHFTGYRNEATTGKEIEAAVLSIIEASNVDTAGEIPEETAESAPEALSLPFFGEVQVKNLSLPLLTLVVALLDGFNPCAMWTLLFLISLLLGMKDRKRMWILGSTFIVSSALVYFLFLSAWLNLFLFLGMVVWIRVLIGLVALGAGVYNLRDYFVNRGGGCSVMGDEKRQKVFEKIKAITQKSQFWLALGGIILLAVAVNMVELICSAGLPAIYTKVLSLSSLPTWQYYLYLLFYVFIFMLDDLFIFFTAMITLQAMGIQSKYSRFSHLIGGVLMFIIGLLLLIKPEWLMFG